MEDEAKAAQEIAKTVGKGIDAAREAGGFIAKYIAGPLEDGVGIFHDRLKYARWERQQRLMLRAEQFLKQCGLAAPSRPVPLKLAVPILQGATLEENDELQDRWARLLVNAANANFEHEVQRSFVGILEQLSPLDAQVLEAIYSLPQVETRREAIFTAQLPESARWFEDSDKGASVDLSKEISIALGNLTRLGCIRAPGRMDGGESFSRVNPTTLGWAFVVACRLPTADQPGRAGR